MDPVLRAEATRWAWGWGRGVQRGDGVTGGHRWLLAQGHAAPAKHHTRQIHFSRPKKSLFALGGGFWLFAGSQAGAGLRRSVRWPRYLK